MEPAQGQRPPAGRLRLARYLGLSGAAAVAVASYTAGARQTGQPGPLDWQRLTTDHGYALGGAAWYLGLAALLTAWWLARGAGARWTLTTSALWTIPVALSTPVASRDIYAYANQGDLYANGVNPYHFGPASLPTQWLDQMDDFWFTEPAPYGPLFIVLSAAIAVLSTSELTVAVIALRLAALAGALACVYFVPKLARLAGVPPASAMWLSLACPLTLIHLVGGAHNEALMLAGVLAALHLAGRGRTWWCAVALGLAVAVKATALVAAPFALLLLVPAPAWSALLAGTVRLATGTVAVFAAVTLAAGLDLGWLSALSVSGKSVSWLSPPTGVGISAAKAMFQLGQPAAAELMVPAARTVGLLLAAATVSALWWRARGTPPAAVLAAAGWAFTAVMVLGPVLLPWYALPPLLLLACAITRRRLVTGVAVVATVLTVIVYPDGHNIAAENFVKPGLLLDLALAAAGTVLAWRWWHTSPTTGTVTPAPEPATSRSHPP